jgi:hypothetical protein
MFPEKLRGRCSRCGAFDALFQEPQDAGERVYRYVARLGQVVLKT